MVGWWSIRVGETERLMSRWPAPHALIVDISVCRPGGPLFGPDDLPVVERSGGFPADSQPTVLFRGIDGNLEAAARIVSGEKGAGRPLPLAEGSRNLFLVDHEIVSISNTYKLQCHVAIRLCVRFEI